MLSALQIEVILRDGPTVPAREIGRLIGVSHGTVTRVLRAHGAEQVNRVKPPGNWRVFPEAPSYEVSDEGGVWSNLRGTLLKCRINAKTGYREVSLEHNGQPRMWLVHRMVLITFVGPCPPGMQGAHEDGKRANCALHNLSWKSPKANAADKRRHGTQHEGEESHLAKLTKEQVAEIRKRCARGEHGAALAREFGVTPTAVSYITRGKQWRNQEVLATPAYQGEQHQNAKLTDAAVREIRQRAAAGEPLDALATAFGVHTATLRAAVTRKTWKHVP